MRRAATTVQLPRDKTSFRTPFSRATPRHLASTRRIRPFSGAAPSSGVLEETPRGKGRRKGSPFEKRQIAQRPTRFPHAGKLIAPGDRRRRISSLFFVFSIIPWTTNSVALSERRCYKERKREREREREEGERRSLSHGESLRKESQLQATRLIYATKGPRYGQSMKVG
jgi:hypothetical protein